MIDEGWLEKLKIDTYFGDGIGNPPFTVRISSLETFKREVEVKMDKIEAKIDKAQWLLIAALVAAVGNLVLHIMGK